MIEHLHFAILLSLFNMTGLNLCLVLLVGVLCFSTFAFDDTSMEALYANVSLSLRGNVTPESFGLLIEKYNYLSAMNLSAHDRRAVSVLHSELEAEYFRLFPNATHTLKVTDVASDHNKSQTSNDVVPSAGEVKSYYREGALLALLALNIFTLALLAVAAVQIKALHLSNWRIKLDLTQIYGKLDDLSHDVMSLRRSRLTLPISKPAAPAPKVVSTSVPLLKDESASETEL